MEKARITTMQQERDVAGCFSARGGNGTSNTRTGFRSVVSPSATVHRTGDVYAGSWWGRRADMLTRIPVTQ